MRIRKPANLGTGGIVMITGLSVFSGYYIWKPAFEELLAANKAKLEKQQNEFTFSAISLLRRTMGTKFGLISVVIIGLSVFYGVGMGIKYKVMPYYKLNQLRESEKFAEIIYKSESK